MSMLLCCFFPRVPLVERLLPIMVTKIVQLHLLFGLGEAIIMSASFAMVMNYLNDFQIPNLLPLVYLKFMKPQGFPWLVNCIFLFETYNLMYHMIAFMKDEGVNMMSMVTTLGSIVDCHLLKLQQVYESACFVFKAYYCDINYEKVTIGLKHVNLKVAPCSLQKKITWMKIGEKKCKNRKQHVLKRYCGLGSSKPQ